MKRNISYYETRLWPKAVQPSTSSTYSYIFIHPLTIQRKLKPLFIIYQLNGTTKEYLSIHVSQQHIIDQPQKFWSDSAFCSCFLFLVSLLNFNQSISNLFVPLIPVCHPLACFGWCCFKNKHKKCIDLSGWTLNVIINRWRRSFACVSAADVHVSNQ